MTVSFFIVRYAIKQRKQTKHYSIAGRGIVKNKPFPSCAMCNANSIV